MLSQGHYQSCQIAQLWLAAGPSWSWLELVLSSSSQLEGGEGEGGSFWHLLTETVPAAPSLPKPCQVNQICCCCSSTMCAETVLCIATLAAGETQPADGGRGGCRQLPLATGNHTTCTCMQNTRGKKASASIKTGDIIKRIHEHSQGSLNIFLAALLINVASSFLCLLKRGY